MIAYRQLPPTVREAEIARSSGRILARHAGTNRPLMLNLTDDEGERSIELPTGAVSLLAHALEAMAAGRGVTLVPEHVELTTVQAADVLNVSRPHLIKLLDEKTIPYRRVGTHRRIRMEDVMAYKSAVDREREEILDRLTREAQEDGMGYNRS